VRRRRNLSLVARIVAASALLAVLVGAAFVILVIALSNLRQTTSEANRSKDVTSATLVLEQHLAALEAGLRGYINTSDPRFLRSWREARAGLADSTAAFRAQAADNPEQERRAQRLAASIEEYVSDYAAPLIAIAQVSPSIASSATAVTEGRRRLEAIRNDIATMLRIENDLAAARVSSAKSQASRAIAVGLGALAISVVLVLLFGAVLARRVARPIRRTSEAATELAAGDLAVRVPEAGPGEVGELAVAFNRMAESLERSQRKLEGQNLQLRESERLRFELVSAISHEVRTPLACVMGYTSLLLTRDVGEEERRQYLQIMADEARRLESLVDDLVDAKRIEQGRLVLEEELFDLGDVVRDQADSFAGRSPGHVLRVERDEHDPLVVHADRGRMAQVIANLLSNAIKYSPAGSTVDVVARRERDAVRVDVRDDGEGIPVSDRSRIFSKFFRGEAAQSGAGGVGLGLAISREIVEAHGGRMGFESEPGHGALFWFELPVARP
jgi:signal transduction histidine kinase